MENWRLMVEDFWVCDSPLQGEVRALKSANKKLESELEECSAKLERDATSSTSRIAKLTKVLSPPGPEVGDVGFGFWV
jgi:hypothetical protein